MKNNGKMTVAFLVVGLLGLIAGGGGIAVIYFMGDFERYFNIKPYPYYMIAVMAVAVLTLLLAGCFAIILSKSFKKSFRWLAGKIHEAETAQAAAEKKATDAAAALTSVERKAEDALAARTGLERKAADSLTARTAAERKASEAVAALTTVERKVQGALAAQAASEQKAENALAALAAAEQKAENAFAAQAAAEQKAADAIAALAAAGQKAAAAVPVAVPAVVDHPLPAAAAIDAETAAALLRIKSDAVELKALAGGNVCPFSETPGITGDEHTDTQDRELLISEIEDIAFRAHLLSLNVAIEISNEGDSDGSLSSIADDVHAIENKSVSIANKCKVIFAAEWAKQNEDPVTAGLISSMTEVIERIANAVDSIAAAGVSERSRAPDVQVREITGTSLPISPIDPTGISGGLFN
jgi:hypothetical protein